MTGQESDFLVLRDGAGERRVPVREWLRIGRECLGIDDAHRLIIDRRDVSRNHLEVRLEPVRGRAIVIDLSTNGTRLNGVRLGRAVQFEIKSGDRLGLADIELEFRSERFLGESTVQASQTRAVISSTDMVLLAGDVIGYSTTSQVTDSEELAAGMAFLFHELLHLLVGYGGVFANHAGDAFFSVWEPAAVPEAADRAIAFALAAVDRVGELAPGLAFTAPDGGPVRMGWAVVRGDVAVGSMAGALLTVVGDATNLAFRLSGLAGRNGRSPVLVSSRIREAASHQFRFAAPEDVSVKGRTGSETVYGVESDPVCSG
jgi:class 3 adenylate cyclase